MVTVPHQVQPHQVTFENVLGTWQRSQTHQTSVLLSTRVMQQNHAEISPGSKFCSSLITLWATDVEIPKLLAVEHWRTFWNCGTYMHTIHIHIGNGWASVMIISCWQVTPVSVLMTLMEKCLTDVQVPLSLLQLCCCPILLEMCCWHKIQMFTKSWATEVNCSYPIFIWIKCQKKSGNQTFRFANVLNSVVSQFLINVWGIILFEYADFQHSE